MSVGWFTGDADLDHAIQIDRTRSTVLLNRAVVEHLFDQLPADAAVLLDGMVLRGIAAYLFGPPEYLWQEAAERLVRLNQEQGLGEDFAWAFAAAHRILESHRLDRFLLYVRPQAAPPLAAWIGLELEAQPTFEAYPRAEMVMGRPDPTQ